MQRWPVVSFLWGCYIWESLQILSDLLGPNSSAKPFQKHLLSTCWSSLWNVHFEFVVYTHYGHVWSIISIYLPFEQLKITIRTINHWVVSQRQFTQETNPHWSQLSQSSEESVSHPRLLLRGSGNVLEREPELLWTEQPRVFLVTFPPVPHPFQCISLSHPQKFPFMPLFYSTISASAFFSRPRKTGSL